MHQDDRPAICVGHCGNRVWCLVCSADWPPCSPHYRLIVCGYHRYDSFLQGCSRPPHLRSLQATSFFSRPQHVRCFHDRHEVPFLTRTKQSSWSTVCWRALRHTGGLHWQCCGPEVHLASSHSLHRFTHGQPGPAAGRPRISLAKPSVRSP